MLPLVLDRSGHFHSRPNSAAGFVGVVVVEVGLSVKHMDL